MLYDPWLDQKKKKKAMNNQKIKKHFQLQKHLKE